VLAEIGDDRTRFGNARALKAYAGSAPVARACGRSICITHRQIKNDRRANVGWMWAFSAPPHSCALDAGGSPGARRQTIQPRKLAEPPDRSMIVEWLAIQDGVHIDPMALAPSSPMLGPHGQNTELQRARRPDERRSMQDVAT
jgi:hypothetical protein